MTIAGGLLLADADVQDDRWHDACLAARIFAANPSALGGIIVRAAAGPVRDIWLDILHDAAPADMAVRKMPSSIQEDRLLGGLDLTATLEARRPVARNGLLSECDGGIVIASMAERMTETIAAHLAGALDQGEVLAERDGLTLRQVARIGIILMDEGASDDEQVPASLRERCAIHLDLTEISWREARAELADDNSSSEPIDDDSALETLCGAAMALGIDSARAPIFALKVAREIAGLAGRTSLNSMDIRTAARLVLAPRATMFPQEQSPDAPAEEPQPESSAEEPPPPPPDSSGDAEEEQALPDALTEMVVDAIRAVLPANILSGETMTRPKRASMQAGRSKGAQTRSMTRGRPAGSRAGEPRDGARLSVTDTLRVAAPWQAMRKAEAGDAARPLEIRRSDLRIRRYIERAQAITIFLVDASGSAALERLAEAKGAVELLLAEAYVRRAQVALVAFRGPGAEVMLPPTRSLARAKNCLTGLTGGGGTPLAAGIEAGHQLALSARAKGMTPYVVLMTDGRANICRDGSAGRAQADAESETAARMMAADGIACVLVDIAARAREEGPRLAAVMRAVYAPLPRVEASALRDVVRRADPSQRAG